ncbi:MAG: phosphatidylserine/phosphatidylglycerophosphate/cardiolipin synthase family protein [Thermoplasmata archaeon]|jgi:cardiolipin synthase A/B
MAASIPENPAPLERNHVDLRASQKMPPTWVTPAGNIAQGIPTQGGQDGVWETDPTGALRHRAIQLMERAKEIVCVSSFILADSELHRSLLAASARGVRVYLLTACEQKLLKDPRVDDEFSERVQAEHVKMLDELALRTLLRSGEDLHAKFLVVDPQGPSPQGILFTCNLATEGLTRNPELGIELSQAEATDLFRMFLWGFWKQSKRELLELGKITGNRPYAPTGLSPPKTLPCTVGGSTTLREEVLRLIEGSRKDLWVSCWKFIADHPATKALRDAAARGVRVRLLTSVRPAPDHMEALVGLVRAGVEVQGHRYLHAKAIVSDCQTQPQGLVMSANFDVFGLDQGYEAGVSLTGKRLSALQVILSRWWESSTTPLLVDKTLGELPEQLVKLYRDGGFEDIVIAKERRVDLGKITARSPGEMETTRPPRFPEPETKGSRAYYKEIHYTWTVLPPEPPKGNQSRK